MNPTRQAKLKDLLAQLDNLGKVEKPQVKNQSFQIVPPDFFDNLNAQLEKFKGELNFQPIIDSVKSLQDEMINSEQVLRTEFTDKINALPKNPDLTNNIARLQIDFGNKLKSLGIETAQNIQSIKQQFTTFIEADDKEDLVEKEELDKRFASVDIQVKKLQDRGGGSMNRQIRVEGVDVLKKYSDINIYGTNSSVITSVDNINKRINIGIQGGAASSTLALQVNGTPNGSQSLLNLKQGTNITVTDDGVGGVTVSASAGSVVSGITRFTSVISVSSTMGAALLTDYVIQPNVGVQVTLPTAISNSNLYTVKNLAVSSVLIATSVGQTIDGSSNALLTTQYQSLDLISNGSVWSVI